MNPMLMKTCFVKRVPGQVITLNGTAWNQLGKDDDVVHDNWCVFEILESLQKM